MAGIIIVDQVQNASNTGRLTFDDTGNFTTGNLICTGTITGGTGLLNIGSGQIYKDTNGNVGIGTSSPLAKLVVSNGSSENIEFTAGSSITNGGVLQYINRNSGSTRPDMNYYLSAYGSHKFYTSDSLRLTLDSSGNLGLGVTPNTCQFGIVALQIKDQGFISFGGGKNLSIGVNRYFNGGDKYIGTGFASHYTQDNGMHQWFTAPSGTSGNAISFTQAMTLDASGNLLVGKTAQSASTEGNMLGLTASGYHYNESVSTNGDGTLSLWYLNRQSSDGKIFVLRKAGIEVGSVSVTGSGTAYNTSSDKRLKTNITPAGSAIQSILDFPVDQFDWISSGEHQNFGAVAQKAIKFIPEMVSAPTDPDEMWGIDWSKAVPRLIKTIQEQQEIIEKLTARITALESK